MIFKLKFLFLFLSNKAYLVAFFIAITIFGKETFGHLNPAVSIAYYIFIAETTYKNQ